MCRELFSGNKEKIVSSNVKGITAILLFAGFNVITPEQSKKTKKELKICMTCAPGSYIKPHSMKLAIKTCVSFLIGLHG